MSHTKISFPLHSELAGEGVAIAMDVENSVRAMDSLYKTNFYHWVRDHQNIPYIAVRLQKLSNEAGLRRLALAMHWLASGWPQSRRRFLFQSITFGWEESKCKHLARELLLACNTSASRKSWKSSYREARPLHAYTT
ncbi:hypothetical protein K493DRAFT_298317 [Basidiobolus meristosporus CBS 931.73]|uniref:Uncharacterized protein n=1 Tax=Basidiobolus meristosporus CBS 931.73 TaxID=1314790 RepID=A0A1Y1YUL6_9FUNG|nr:hypothetical protein K493DRAFT_298317 [Basidiobolus meristosporus CBS 931.73]|eukprot:ORY01534.1 hypothetical protein K493DRAFT_298317 [Basidiobolus meristosporus CBS 931.73]